MRSKYHEILCYVIFSTFFFTLSPSGPSISPSFLFLKTLNLYRRTSVPETKLKTHKNRDQNYNFVYFFY